MSNKKNICNNSFIDHDNNGPSKKTDLPLNESQDFLNNVIEELCNVYNKEVIKGNLIDSILHSINQHFTNKKQNPKEIINLCLINQTNPISD
ncbi:23023_t:CDS:2 [Cetraspora pellucida]|uniref:23023_t:CDS:1 n=1 Tax=Cetraspora pellucida TaxID=1433469 RepID=A0A9N8WEE9_9GLOM|nr:23023_t:CDS:2 [Cetraspora pellucida]